MWISVLDRYVAKSLMGQGLGLVIGSGPAQLPGLLVLQQISKVHCVTSFLEEVSQNYCLKLELFIK